MAHDGMRLPFGSVYNDCSPAKAKDSPERMLLRIGRWTPVVRFHIAEDICENEALPTPQGIPERGVLGDRLR